jgi:hypothetical protein
MLRIISILVALGSAPLWVNAGGIPKHTVAFATEHDGSLFYADLPAGGVHSVPVGPLRVSDLAYSATRGQLAFSAARHHGSPRSIVLMDASTGKTTTLLAAKANSRELYRPVFDPSGQHLYAVNYRDGVYRYAFNLRRWDKVAITGHGEIHPQQLSFSQSGQRVAIAHDNFVGFLIAHVVSDKELRIEREILQDFDSVISPIWLSDDAILFAGRKKPGLQFLWKLAISSGALEQLTTEPIGARDFLAVSKDLQTVAFTATEEKASDWRLWQLQFDNLAPTQLTQGAAASSQLFPVFVE